MTIEQNTPSPATAGLGRTTSWPGWLVLGAPLVVGAAVATRTGLLGIEPHFDELYHLFAARGWLESGAFRIEGGVYDRAAIYTRMVAAALERLGDTLELARLTSVAFGSALVLAVFVWLGLAAGAVAAGIGALFMVLWPDGIVASQMLRFYALHGLVFFLAAAGIFHLATAPPAWGRSLLVGGGTVLCLALAIHLQPITFIGLVGIATWVAAFVALPAILARRGRWWILGALLAAGGAVAALAYRQGLLAAAWERFRWVPEWAAHRQDDLTFYFNLVLFEYPAVWPLLLLSVVLACGFRPRLGSFCATLFLVAFVLHSLGGMKHARYVYYLVPFWFMLIALAGAAVAGPFRRTACRLAAQALCRLVPPLATPRIAGLAVAVAVLFAFVANPAVRHAVALSAGGGTPRLDPTAWRLAQPALRKLVEGDTLVATTDEMKALHFLGEADLVVNASRLSELDGADEFAIDPRTGLPVVSTAASLRRVIACAPRGVFVTARHFWERDRLFQTATDGLAATRTRMVDLPQASSLVAAEWTSASPDAAACAGIDDVVRRAGR